MMILWQRVFDSCGHCSRFGRASATGASDTGYIEAIPLPRIVCKLGADPEHCEERMARRGYPQRLCGVSREERLAVLHRCSTCIEMAVAALKNRGVSSLLWTIPQVMKPRSSSSPSP
jgi:hypothetical protein